jgi:hypothetical protein
MRVPDHWGSSFVKPAAPDLAAMNAAAAWAWLAGELAAAVGSARHGLHLLTVATVGADGQPDARTVVLRHVDPLRREIRFHSDIRSPKVQTLRTSPRVALHWYDPALRVQVRVAALAAIHHGDTVATAAWTASQTMSRAIYTTAVAPGDALDAFPEGPAAPAADDDTGLGRFAVVACRFDTVELLSLHAAGHQRVRLHLDCNPVTWTVLAP